jgi:AMMECR1 domain-containing protein
MRSPLILTLALLALAPAASARELKTYQRPAMRTAIAKLTHDAIWAHVKHLPPPSADLGGPAGVFVTISKAGVTRGCWGTVAPRNGSLGAELAANAVKALSHDYRQQPIQPRELAELVAHVSVVGELDPVDGPAELQPRKFGLLVSGNGKGGVLLPGEAATAAWAVATCRRKAGLSARERARMYKFETAVVGPVSLAE